MKHLPILLSCMLSLPCLADTTISGPIRVLPLQAETYQVNWGLWGDDAERNATVTWTVQNGLLFSYDKHSATVHWYDPSGPQSLQGSIDVSEDYYWQTASLNVEVVGASSSEFCEGVLGPAAIAVDFGSGDNPGAPLPAGATTYTYNPNCAISPSQYTRRSHSIDCRAPWHSIVEDHTPGDRNGYFLMVDADSQPGELYRTTVNGLTPAFKYEFSVWVGNLDRNSLYEPPRVRFEIRHVASGFMATSGDIIIPPSASFQWQKIGFMFELPPGVTSADVVMVNRNQNDLGNDLVLDDISFAPCYPPIIASFQNGVVVDRKHSCNSGAADLHAWWPSTIPFTRPAYQWQRLNRDDGWLNIPGATALHSSYTEPSPGIYQYRLMSYETSNPAQSVVSNPLTHFVQRLTVTPRAFNVYACNGGVASDTLPAFFQLEYSDPSVPKSYSAQWSPTTYLSDPNSISPSIVLPSAGPSPAPNGPPAPPNNYTYTVTIADTVSTCSGSAPYTVAQHNPRKVAVPNAFTPDGDQLNDLFRPLNLQDYPGSRFFIYNRWGQLIFESNGPALLNYSWNGKFHDIDQAAGTYVWRVEISACPGNIINSSTGDNSPSGTVNLIR
ncbi:gliding motility-associated C-terminal domain-containing protein [Myxococcus sp. K15C18031901]|uniref:gliding motility-associated C-terminal domain-containing protein n=1 Tax=Myxococcus dinghuensis TaxID=2906761 RepID=UPI0020A76CCE|nr:gliding motility-associated C-terminal domain-containing protein [Myxococcus dinghuensis]MCP3105252.1 gliding motility-associated C-terminal domain-containing protein [Myxococcus dinghuensis]